MEDLFHLRGLELWPLLGELQWSFRASRVLHVAASLGIHDRLQGRALTAAELAHELETDPDYTERLLIALCATGLLDKSDGRYCNSVLGETFMVSGSPLYQGDILGHSDGLWDFWLRLEAVVRTGHRDASLQDLPPQPEGRGHQYFIRGMHNTSVAGPVQMLTQAVDLAQCRRLLDVGGGPGTFSIALCQRYPELECVLWDLPDTLAISREFVNRFGLADRIRLQPGDWDQDDFGEQSFDALLMSNVLHGPGSKAAMKLGKAYQALVPGGWLLVHDFVLNAEKTGPLAAAVFNIMVGTYSEPELRHEIEAAGFAGAAVRAHGDRGNLLMVAHKPGG